MKNIVLLGDANSIYIKEYIENVLLEKFNKIAVLTYGNSWDKWNKWYEKYGIQVYSVGVKEEWKELSDERRKQLVNDRRQEVFAKFGYIDVLQVHYCAGPIMYCYKQLAKKSKRRIMTYWGSDLLRAKQYDIELNVEAIELTDTITVIDDKMQSKLVAYYGDLVADKHKIIDFGVSSLHSIRECERTMDSAACKQYFGIKPSDTTVMIGYNGHRTQQHLMVINQIIQIPKEYLENVTFVFHMGYGLTEEYYAEVENAIMKTGCKYKIITDFFNYEEIAKLRLACDIFIHAQTTDAFSASVSEYLYAGSKLINPTWINYIQYDNSTVMYYKYNSFEELPALMETVLADNCIGNNQLEETRAYIESLVSWNRWKPLWHEVLWESSR